MSGLELGKIAYDSYRGFSGGQSLVSDAPLPTYEQMAPQIQAAWAIAATTVAIHVTRVCEQTALETLKKVEIDLNPPGFDTNSAPEG